MDKHTPGPWVIVESSDPRVISKWSIKIGRHEIGFFPYVCQYANESKTRGVYVPDREMHANARLIAAAPELLEALEELLSALDRQMTDPDRLFRSKTAARAVAAKAKGGAP